MSTALRNVYYAVVSPEALVIVLAVGLVTLEPSWIKSVSAALTETPDALKYVAFLPVAVFAWCWKNGQGVLFPSEDTKGILQRWPRYHELKARIFIGLMYQALFSVASVGAWTTSPSLSQPLSPILVGGSIVGSAIGACTFYMATISAREITKRAST